MNALTKVFEKWPRTEIVQDRGRTIITVLADHLQPDMAQGCDVLGKILPTMLLCFGALSSVASQDPETLFGPALGSVIGFVTLSGTFRKWGRVMTTVIFTEDAITVHKPAELWTPHKPQVFDRQHPHRFVLYPHDKARAEREENEFLSRSRPHARHAQYYGHSYFVVLEYFGQRFDIAEVFGEREARAILDRLNLCDTYMGGLVNAARSLPIRPEDEWSGPTSSVPR